MTGAFDMPEEQPISYDECVVLKSMQYHESDRIVTIFSKTYGKTNILARGACKPNSKLSGFTDSLSILQYVPKTTRTFTLMTQPRIISPLFHIKEIMGKSFFQAFSICELVLRAAEQDTPMPLIYEALKNTLIVMDLLESSDGFASEKIVLKFKLFFLHRLGFDINHDHCSGCGKKMDPALFLYDSDRGASVCSRCAIGRPNLYEMSKIIKTLLYFSETSDLKQIIDSEYTQYEISQASSIVRHHIRANLHISLASESMQRQ